LLDLDDVAESSSGGIHFADRSRSSQREPIVIEDDDNDGCVVEDVDVEDADEETVIGGAMTTDQCKKWYKSVLEALAESGTQQSSRLFRSLPVEVCFSSRQLFQRTASILLALFPGFFESL
jgi:hypothetical protein